MTPRSDRGARAPVVSLAGAALIWALAPAAAIAQTPSVRDVLSALMTTRDVQTGDFESDQQAAAATRDTVARALLVNLASLPITSSSGGFSYEFNPALGTAERATPSFGPFFVDRATTAGRNQASVSVTYQYMNYVNLNGRNLRDGSFVTTATQFRDEAQPFDVEALNLRLETSTVTAFANYGVTDSLDLGVAVPIVRLTMSGERVNVYRGTSAVVARGVADSSGVADIAVRGKIQFVRTSAARLAANVELRLPTGSPDDLRGAGSSALRVAAIASLRGGAVESHVNAGASLGGVSREVDVAAALVTPVSSRVTLSGEGIVRWIRGLGTIESVAQPHPAIAGVDTIRLLPGTPGLATAALVGGVRWNIAGTWLLNAHVLVPVLDHGLTARPSPAISLDYAFAP